MNIFKAWLARGISVSVKFRWTGYKVPPRKTQRTDKEMTIITGLLAKIGLGKALGGLGLAVLLPLLSKPVRAKITGLAASFIGKNIAIAENFATGDPAIDGRLNLAILCLMDVANRKMPTAPGATKKAYVMTFFAKMTPAVQTFIGDTIDALWATMKTSVDAGVTAPQESIIEDAVAKLKALKPAIPSQGAFARAHEAWLERNKRRG